jgi:tRNA pseudouridine13 synthase
LRDFNFTALARVNPSAASCSAGIRRQADYFQVDEVLPFEPDGEGGHVWLKIRKKGINTDWLANELAGFAKVPQVAVGYAGLKDRHAVTTQWFSIKVEGITEPDWSEFETEDIQIVEQTRHGKKLKRGVLAGNIFDLRLTDMTGNATLWQQHLEVIQQQGVPNYFAEQRFGRQLNNLHRVGHWFETGKAPKKRQQKSLYLSAARSWLFNLVLDQRLQLGNWNQAIDGDVMVLAGTKASLFNAEFSDSALSSRLAKMDIHPTGPLWGRGTALTQTASLALEQQVLSSWDDWQAGLEKAGMKQERRALRLFPQDFEWQFLAENQLQLRFFLPAGCYATAVMRELAVISDVSHRTS